MKIQVELAHKLHLYKQLAKAKLEKIQSKYKSDRNSYITEYKMNNKKSLVCFGGRKLKNIQQMKF